MAPLEEEVVNQVLALNKGLEKEEREQEVQEKCAAIREYGGLAVDDKKVRTAMERYFLVEAYSIQDSSRKAIKRTVQELINRTYKERTEMLMSQSPSIVSIKRLRTKRNNGRIRHGGHCNGKRFEQRVKFNWIEKSKAGIYLKKAKKRILFSYCSNCGEVSFYEKNPFDYRLPW